MKKHLGNFINNMKSALKAIAFIIVGLLIGAAGSAWYTITIKNKEIELLKTLQQQEITFIQTDLDQCKKTYAAREQEIASKLAYESMPDLPVKVDVRQAFLSDTRVLQLTNFSNNSLRVQIEWSAEGTTLQKIGELYPNQQRELGHREGYPFKPGDEVSISSSGYKTKNLRIP